MAIDTAEKRRNVGGNMPTPDGTISIFDRRQVAGNYRGVGEAYPVGLSGGMTPTGALATLLTAYRSLSGGLTPTGAVARALSAYRSLGGTLTPIGDLGAVLTAVVALGGELDLMGDLSASNPAWLLIDDKLRWMGEWVITTTYDKDDVVLHKTDGAAEWHVFISKVIHNTGNIPTSSAAWWRRLYQEPLL